MKQSNKDITLTKNRSRVEIKSVDGWIFDVKYFTNGKESYSSQIIKSDIQDKVESLKRSGYKMSNSAL